MRLRSVWPTTQPRRRHRQHRPTTAQLGYVSLSWDGLPATGTWPADFDGVIVHASPINNFTPAEDGSTIIDRLYAKGVVPYFGAYGVPVYFKLIAVDKTGLKSTPSAQATATPTRLVGTDISADAITYEQIAFKDPGNVVQDGSFESIRLSASLDRPLSCGMAVHHR